MSSARSPGSGGSSRAGRSRRTGRARGEVKKAAERLPVARIAVDVSLPHLDRPFDYLVSVEQHEAAVPGCRVRVRFAGQLVNGYLLERVEGSEHEGRLAFLDRVVSAEPVLAPEIARLARSVADRWAGTLPDVLRLAVPPRHAAAEGPPEGARKVVPVSAPPQQLTSGLHRYAGGGELFDDLAGGASPRGVLSALPGAWPDEIASAAAATVAGGRGVVVVVPDHRDVVRVDAALQRMMGPGHHVALTADLGPAERYRRFLAVCRGQVRCAVGTRSAVWAPVKQLGLVVVWDDGDDLLAEPRAPYCHVRDVAVLRAHLAGSGLLVAGYAVSTEALALVTSGWAMRLDPTEAARRTTLPAVRTGTDEGGDRDPLARAARLPTLAWQTARDALAAGAPVLVQVPRRGYQPSLACDRCRLPARCPACAGPLARRQDNTPPGCSWCGVVATDWRCAHCSHDRLRAVVVGARRTAEELGRAFPGVRVRTSGGDAVLAEVPDRPALVVATPGAEPVADKGYGAALLLDGWMLLSRPDLRAAEEALRRWLNAAALVRGAPDGGRVVVVAPGELRPVQALLRWQPWWHAERETEDRSALHLPPAARIAALTGVPAAVRELLDGLALPAGAEVLGPVPVPGQRPGDEEQERMLVRVPRATGLQLAELLREAAAGRSARKAPDNVRIELDPQQLG